MTLKSESAEVPDSSADSTEATETDQQMAAPVHSEASSPGQSPDGPDGSHDRAESAHAVLPLRDTVVFPEVVVPVLVGREKSLRLVENLTEQGENPQLLVGTLKDAEVEDPGAGDFYDIGTLVRVIQMLRAPDGSVRLVIEGLERRRITKFTSEEPFFSARSETLASVGTDSPEAEATLRSVQTAFQRMVEFAPYLPEQLVAAALNVTDAGRFADFLAANVNIDIDECQELLATPDVAERLHRLLRILTREIDLLEMGTKINEQIKGEFEGQQREFVLRRQLEAIKKELGEDDEASEVAELRRRFEETDLPEEARVEAERELKRLEEIPTMSPEHSVIRTYLDWMLDLPWGSYSDDNFDVSGASERLDSDHYGLDKPKDRILEYLAVREFNPDIKGPILAFVGPPGVGKTSLGQSIADATGREFVRMSLGGVHDESELRGHRRTYVGAMPGRIVTSLKRAGTMNPVIMLDEVDKLGADYRGDPAAALLEILDPAQNDSFTDHYLDVPLDLSKVMFIATANIVDTIPRPLLDRMELIEVPGYTEADKRQIARKYLVPRQLEEHGLDASRVEITDDALDEVIGSYTREAGVRTLERQIASLIRKAARKLLEGADEPVTVDGAWVKDALGPERFEHDLANEADEIGLVTGLSWTPAGGDVLSVEAAVVPGSGKLTLTGQLGDVMQESAQAALTYVRQTATAWGLADDWAETNDVHIHVPAGAIPKDGPSAGVTMTTALVSAVTRRPVSRTVAMTGEVTLRGKVLPIGGLKEKLLAAHRAGIERVVIPEKNVKDLVDVPEFVRNELEIIPVGEVDDVLTHALAEPVAI